MEVKFGKTIKTYLIDGAPNGRLACELSNWTGKIYKIPRTLIKESIERKELNSTGVYILFGKDPSDPDTEMAYIGETEDIMDRFRDHLDKKEFWNESLAIISKDDNLNKAHVKYLEFRMYEIAISVGRYRLDISRIPTRPTISESDIAEMEEFLYNMKLLINSLGYKVFEQLKQIKNNKLNTFGIQATRGANAEGIPTTEGFVVLA